MDATPPDMPATRCSYFMFDKNEVGFVMWLLTDEFVPDMMLLELEECQLSPNKENNWILQLVIVLDQKYKCNNQTQSLLFIAILYIIQNTL